MITRTFCWSANWTASRMARSREAITINGSVAFQHRQHGLVFQIGLETFFLGSLGFLIAAGVFEEFLQLAQFGLVVLLRIRECSRAGKIATAEASD